MMRHTLGFGVLVAAVTLAVSVVLTEEAPELEAYAVPGGDFKKAAELIRPMLTKTGFLIEDRAKRRLLVHDEPAVHRKVELLFPKWMAPGRNIRIRVSSRSPQQIVAGGYNVSGRGRVGDVVIQTGKTGGRNGIQVRAQSGKVHTDLNFQQELLVASGAKGAIEIAEEVPDTAWFVAWGQPFNLWTSDFQWKNVGSKMIIEPTVLADNTIRVRLTPSFSYYVDRQLMTTEVQKLSTDVIVADGAEIDLGGVQMGEGGFLKKFLTRYDEYGNVRQVNFKLRATIEELPPRPDYEERKK